VRRLWILSLASAAALAGPPSRLRPPMQAEFDRCALWAEEHGNRSLSGRLRLELLIRKSGNVYGAFVWSERGIDDRKFERCLTSAAPVWVFPPVPVDYQRPYAPSFVHSGTDTNVSLVGNQQMAGMGRASIFLPDINELPEPTPINVVAAQGTLELADWATAGERAYAQALVRRYPEAIKEARDALASDPGDGMALRALAQSLAESGGDLVDARRAAERLIALDADSVAGHEALLRVCLAARDDRCAFEEWSRARKAKDMQPRSRLLAELQGPTQLAAERLQTAARAGQAGKDAPRPADPCAAEKGEEAQALCVVKRCLDEGSAAYAKELSSQNAIPYEARDWRVKTLSAGKFLVTRPIEPVPPRPGVARHDALWLVKSGENLIMRPTNTEARQITVRHNRCTARVAPAP